MMWTLSHSVFLVTLLSGFSVEAKRNRASECSAVKQSFLLDKPAVAATIPDSPEHGKWANHPIGSDPTKSKWQVNLREQTASAERKLPKEATLAELSCLR